jgi:PAS domain S-box-containing protein
VSASQPDRTAERPRWLGATVLTALAYAAVGLMALGLAIPPAYASPLYPSAGIALVAVLVFGWRVSVGVALGALAVNLTTAAMRNGIAISAMWIPLAIAVGAALQALAGAWLVKRFIGANNTLGEPRDIGLFFALGGLLACVVTPSLATLALHLGGALEPGGKSITWLTWWVGDALGVLIGAPIALTLIGRPRNEWAPRRLTVGLTLLLSTGFIAISIAVVAHWDRERAEVSAAREADDAMLSLQAQMQEPLHALEALRGVFRASEDVNRAEVRRATETWLKTGKLAAMGWSLRLPRNEVAAFEAQVRASGQASYRVFDRAPPPGAQPLGADAEVVAIRYIEPELQNAPALGVNANSIPAARQAIAEAARSGMPAATAGFQLTQDQGLVKQVGTVIYAPVYREEGQGTLPDPARLRGVVFVTLRVDTIMRTVLPEASRKLSLCLLDKAPGVAFSRLAGPESCDRWSSAEALSRRFAFAGRDLELRVHARAQTAPRLTGANAWMFALVGLLAASMLGALMLTVTGRTRRIEAAVQARTLDLQTEVSDRKRAQAELQESEQRFRSILDHVPIGVVFVDVDGRVRQANPRFCEMLGYDEATLLTMHTADYTHPDDRMTDVRMAQGLIENKFPMYRLHKRCITRDQRTLWVQATVSLLRDPQGQARYIVGAVEDITEHLRLQEAESARELAEASNRAKNNFLSRMSHELRTPLNAILGFAQLLEFDRKQPLAPEQRPWVGQIQQAGWHLLEMINDVLDLSRIESGNLRLESAPVPLADLIDGALAMVKADAEKRRISLTTRLEPPGLAVLGDATRARQVVINLLSNAVKYNVDGGAIQIAAVRRGTDSVDLSITDTGVGMTAEQQASLFTPFNRLGRERGAAQGTGIGLVISKSLAELMGGTLQGCSAPSGGMTFTLTLPRADAHIDADATATPRLRQAEASPTSDYGPKRVVYVEDNETNVEVMRGVLARRPQIEMAACPDGASGLAEIRSQQPDLLLLDMHLPDTDGLAVLRALRADPATAALPVVAVSADALPQQVQAALAAGAVAYLTKPVVVPELLKVLDDCLMAPRQGAALD